MIDPKELRIGNYIKHFVWDVIQYDPITEPFQPGMFNKVAFDYTDPIPLTDKWMVKFGFMMLQSDYWVITDFKLSKDFFFRWEYGSLEVKYVHQLQNLYFALTGDELTLKQD